ncbi:MAG: hypothetical protein JXN59_17580 [Anaerolineae bacterium]|nr:hypothetical protein [Anaerolineae bacterium]
MTGRPQWEYLFIQVSAARGFTSTTWRVFAVNNNPLPNWERGPEWQDHFQQLGEQGWELVSFEEHFLTNPVVGGKLAIFKRQRGAESQPIRRIQPQQSTSTPPRNQG